MSTTAQPLEHEAVVKLTRELLRVIKQHYIERPTARATAQEVLNAAAVVVAHIIAAARECDDEDGPRDFFQLALEQQLALDEHDPLPTTVGGLPS